MYNLQKAGLELIQFNLIFTKLSIDRIRHLLLLTIRLSICELGADSCESTINEMFLLYTAIYYLTRSKADILPLIIHFPTNTQKHDLEVKKKKKKSSNSHKNK